MTAPTSPFDFDLFVIGGGSGGVRAARMAAQRGARVALAESDRMGGTCVNVGCIPKKLYSYAAHYAAAFEEARGFGWQLPAPATLDWAALKAARAKEITRLNGVYEGLMEKAGVQRLQGHASLADNGAAHTVQVRSADGAAASYTARHILIATGGTPFVPEDLPGRELAITSNDVFDLPAFPRRLAVVGGGYIGCEMACIFHGLGAQVTQLYRGEQVLRGFDDEVRAFAAEEMRKQGIDLRLNTDVRAIEQGAQGLTLTLSDGSRLPVDAVLYATGRRPLVDGLNLPALGIAQRRNGAIEVNDRFETSASGVYAVGDVVGRKELTPVALAEAMALVDALFPPPQGQEARRMAYDNIPTAIFTHPPIGTVGLSEEQAREGGRAIRVYRSDFKPLKHTLSGSSERTLVKLIVDDASDRVLGLHMVGADAGEIVQGFAVALQCGATKAQFDATLGIHPTSAEEFVTLREVSRR
ncbi:glutathione-disulfide reductase [Allofranklinella schreckenbergeri]|uniref:Glutathione-disulfide reductase n=1 Tax=Allofranklinella schreckenbergeri TaxID=1076744 RepID=A0A3M6Q6N3_9BURK|nr:glutathione-disulfide reductase [Allofranklinella schreckenbergeri]RMW98853.1 glutathione-disulfide reductase [Allofranklinella schreckenbergeri]